MKQDQGEVALKSPDMLQLISQAFGETERAGLSKIAQLYEAISSLISSGAIAEGGKLPGEREICTAAGVSLGTAQKALNMLVRDGDVVREHGRGTFARSNRRALRQLWHFRFRDPVSNALMPVYATVMENSLVPPGPEFRAFLGPDSAGYVKVSRLIKIDNKFRCWSEMYLGASRFGRLLDMASSTLESVNLKELLASEFNAPTLSVSQTVKMQPFDRKIAKQIGVTSTVPGLVLQIAAFSRRQEQITFQRIYVPPVDFELELTDGPADLARSLAA